MKLLNSIFSRLLLYSPRDYRTNPYARDFHVDFTSDKDELGKTLDATFGFIDELDLDPTLSNNVMLCAEELLRNVVLFSKTSSARLYVKYSVSDSEFFKLLY